MKNNIITVTLLVTAGTLLLICVQMIYFLRSFSDESAVNYSQIIYNDENNLSGIAVPILNVYLENEKPAGSAAKTGKDAEGFELTNARLIAQGNGVYAIAVIFKLSPLDANYSNLKSKGTLGPKNILYCEWTFVVRKVTDDQYVLIDSRMTKDFIRELLIEQSEIDRLLLPPAAVQSTYTVKNDHVYTTYNNGTDWHQVPVGNFKEFAGKSADGFPYENQLPAGSVYLTPSKSAFIFASNGTLQVLLSDDAGKTWRTKSIDSNLPENFNSCIYFLKNKPVGYAAVQFHKTVDQAETNFYSTRDGGDTWEKIGSKMPAFLLNNVTFSNENTGFLTFSNHRSSMFTKDGGKTWQELILKLPSQYEDIYSNQLAPQFSGQHGEMYLNVGGNSGCSGEWQTAVFLSENAGLTWKFDRIQ